MVAQRSTSQCILCEKKWATDSLSQRVSTCEWMYRHACWLHSLENWATVDLRGEGVEGLKGAEMQAMLLLFQAYPLPCWDTRFTLWRPGPWGVWVLPGKSPRFYTDQGLWSLKFKHSHNLLDGSSVRSKQTLCMLNVGTVFLNDTTCLLTPDTLFQKVISCTKPLCWHMWKQGWQESLCCVKIWKRKVTVSLADNKRMNTK